MKILQLIEDGRESPRPKYKYEKIKNKYKEIEKASKTLNDHFLHPKRISIGISLN